MFRDPTGSFTLFSHHVLVVMRDYQQVVTGDHLD